MNPQKEVLKRSDGAFGCYSAALPIPRNIMADYFSEVTRWAVCSGKEWTISRCKDIYTDWVRYRAGLSAVGKWYQKRSNGLPSGVIGHLFTLSLTSKRARFAVGTLLRAYTSWLSPEATEKQLKKFLDGVNSEPMSIPSDIAEGVRKATRKVVGRLAVGDPSPYWLYQPSTGKRVPSWEGKTHPEEEHWNSQCLTLFLSYTGRNVRFLYPSIWDAVMAGESASMKLVEPPGGWVGKPRIFVDAPDFVGNIGLIQEPGYKLRAVANPNRIYQAMLKPLGDALFRKLTQLPWDCTHDQSKPFQTIQGHLLKGAQAHCIDLSGATDYFPLELQLDVLRECVSSTHDYVGLFSTLSRGKWRMHDMKVSWKKGQPLGLYPSFASFALTHGLLLFYLNGYRHDNAFFVLGDDVIILDDTLNLAYRSCLDELGCPVSEAKTISSNIMGEFAGKLIFQDDVIPQLKWRSVSDDNFMDVVRLLGKRGLHILRPRQRSVVQKIMDIPEFLGGLGFNPKGLPLTERISKYYDLLSEPTGSYRMGYDDHLNRYFYGSKVVGNVLSTHRWNGLVDIPDLDQRSLALVFQHMPRLYQWYRVLGTNLYTVLEGNPDVLPIDGGTGKRVSLLSRWERKLK